MAATATHARPLLLPVGRVRAALRRARVAKRISALAPLFLTAVLEYLATELIDAAGHVTRDANRRRITPRDIFIAARNDAELDALTAGCTFAAGGVLPSMHQVLLQKNSVAWKWSRRNALSPVFKPA